MKIRVRVNGTWREAEAPPMKRLLDFLREDLGLTGSKEGCGEGECGACTVLLEGRAVNSCLEPVCQADGARVTTIEGLSSGTDLHPVQAAFRETHGLQCGFCTPGMIMSCSDLLRKNPNPSEPEIRDWLKGNICRCTGYQNIVKAVEMASASMSGQRKAAE